MLTLFLESYQKVLINGREGLNRDEDEDQDQDEIDIEIGTETK